MSLSPGSKLAHYEILEPIGKGGMGEVYHARDTKLGRDVAIKVLPEEFSRDRERMERFEREARLLAQLNHSNVATLHGLEESAGRQFLVMELVEGETLAERIAKSPIPIDEAIPLFMQVADGLEAAHEKAIVHRDLKPANIKVGLDGKPKILDFGLAKAFVGVQESGADSSQSPTLTKGTALGAIMGTAAYMSPEQARGKTVDKRTDIWAFGCCLYEALAGKKAFAGETVTDTLAAVINKDPDWEALPGETPASTRRCLKRCLEKDRRRRLRDIGDAHAELELTTLEPTLLESAATGRTRRAWLFPQVIALLAALVGGVLIGVRVADLPQISDGVTRLTISLPAREPVALDEPLPLASGRHAMAISPDGSTLVYVGEKDDGTQLFLRTMDQLDATAMAGTEGGFGPFFSPDGRWIGFFTETALNKVPVTGGAAAVSLCEATNSYGGTWGAGGNIYFAESIGFRLSRISSDGGSKQTIAVTDRGYLWPQLLPGGRALLLSVNPHISAETLLFFLDSGETSMLLGGATDARYVPTGHLVYSQRGALRAAPFDLETLSLTGPGTSLRIAVRTENLGATQYAVSRNGTFVYIAGTPVTEITPVWIDRKTKAIEPLGLPAAHYGPFRLSPDGRRLAFTRSDMETDIWIHDFERGGTTRFTETGNNSYPRWSPDGEWIFFASDRLGPRNLFRERADSIGEPERLTESRFTEHPGGLTPDGKHLFYQFYTEAGGTKNLVLSIEGDRQTAVFSERPHIEWGHDVSPDGRWVAYVSDEPGRYEIFVEPYPTTGQRWQISTEGGEEPLWSPTGEELFYKSGQKYMSVPITTKPDFDYSRPRLLFEGRFSPIWGRSYDVTHDGERFLLFLKKEVSSPTELTVVLNWFDELERLVPTED